MAKRQGRKSAAQTPAPPKERIYGSKKNPKGSAASEKSASKIKLSKDIIAGLEKKLKEFIEKYPSKKNVTLADLKAVFRRGAGAYSKSHRPFITGGVPNSRNAWAYARVNKFLKKAAGQKVKAAYVQDDDLLKMEGGGLVTKKDDVNVPLYHGTIKEKWKNSEYETYLFVTYDLEFAKLQAIDRANAENGTPIIVIIDPNQIKNFKWEVDDDEGSYRELHTWQDSYNSIGSFVIIGKFNINDFEVIEIENQYSKGGEIDPKVLRERWAKKKDALENLANNIQRLRTNLSKDLKEGDEKERLTALVVKIMDETGERVGNDESADNGHFGVTGLKKKHIKVNGSNLKFKYTGKSGVEHEKEINDSTLANAMREAIKNSPSEYVFETSDGFRIKNDRVNRYLNRFDVSAKDLRGYSANKWIITRLKSVKDREILGDAKKRKTKFNEIVKDVAEKVGHGRATLKKHYLLPSLEREFINHGKIVDLSNIKRTYEDGGEVKLNRSARYQFSKDLQEDKDFQEAKKRAIYDERGRTYGTPNVLINDPYVRKQRYKHIKVDDSDINDDDNIYLIDVNENINYAKGGDVETIEVEKLNKDRLFFDYENKGHLILQKLPYSSFHINDYTDKEGLVKELKKYGIDSGEKVWSIEIVKVRPRYRGQGVASKLLSAAIQWAKENKYEKLVLIVEAQFGGALSNEQLYELYSKFKFKPLKKAYGVNWMARKLAKGGKNDDEVNTGIGVINNMDGDPLDDIKDIPNDGIGIFKEGGKTTYESGVSKLINKESIEHLIPTFEQEDINWWKLQHSKDMINQLLAKIGIPIRVKYNLGEGANGTAWVTENDTVLKLTKNAAEGYSSYVIFKNQENFNSQAEIYNIFIVNDYEGVDVQRIYFIEKELLEPFTDSDYVSIYGDDFQHIYNDIEAIATARKYSNQDRVEMLEKLIEEENLSGGAAQMAREIFELAQLVDKEAKAYGLNLSDNHKGNVGFDKKGKLLCYDCAHIGNKKLKKGGNLKNKNMENLKVGGEISQEEKKEIYAKWRKLVNMSKSELQKFYDSEEGKEAGLTAEEAKEAGIDSGRESARWILKMKDTKVAEWTPTMWHWAKKQISFISRMSGNKGKLVDENGKKTRKYLSLLIWGNDPNKKAMGGDVEEPCHVCGMSEAQYHHLPALKEMADGKRFVYKESVFAKGGDTMSHVGDRYLILECMGEGGITDTLNLKVIQSSSPALLVGTIINRPIRNIINKGREMGNTFGEAITGSYKKGGELNPDNKEVKNYFEHKSGAAGGLLVGKRHSEGGIKAINNSTGQPLEMEGGEVVITRDAVSDPKLVEYEGKKMTKREVLSEINQSGGGVAFADGGVVGE